MGGFLSGLSLLLLQVRWILQKFHLRITIIEASLGPAKKERKTAGCLKVRSVLYFFQRLVLFLEDDRYYAVVDAGNLLMRVNTLPSFPHCLRRLVRTRMTKRRQMT